MAEGTREAEKWSVGDPGEITGDRRALDLLFSVTYEELRRLASSVRRSDPGATLSPTMLVNEAWLKLASSPPIAVASRLHFKRIAARAMRQVLVEAARRHSAEKRGGGTAFVTFDDSVAATANHADEFLALDAALEELR
jgi:RNA polymerase sigma factor (TIGR02999 family)